MTPLKATSASPSSPLQFLDGRPEVPRLPLGLLQPAQRAADAQESQAEPQAVPAPVQGRPAVPPLALSKLNPAAATAGIGQPGEQGGRILAAHPIATDASTHRSGWTTGREEGERHVHVTGRAN